MPSTRSHAWTAPKPISISGTPYARQEEYEQAVSSYEEALERRPGWTEAEENLALVKARIPFTPEEESDEAGGDPNLSADEMQFDERGKQGKRGEVDMSMLTDEQLTEMWMRRLTTSPADFLRRRFAMEEARE